MAKYKILGDGVFDTEEHVLILDNPMNSDWIMYQEWVGEGNTADPEFTAQEIIDNHWFVLRLTRDNLLRQTDFMVLQDVYANYTTQEQTDITNYRQALRDLPSNTGDPESPTWPTKPQAVIDVTGE